MPFSVKRTRDGSPHSSMWTWNFTVRATMPTSPFSTQTESVSLCFSWDW